MRPIKFRVWLDEFNKMFYDVGLMGGELYVNIDGKGYDVVGDCMDFKLMQFTGIKDRNGQEIYEGDIVRIWGGEYCQGYWEVDEIGEVVFEEYSFGTKSNGRFRPFNIAFEPYDLEIKVIGNIFEHPHLLEAKGNE